MMHKPIQINDLCLSFPNKICFDDFSYHIRYGERIAIMGRNGSGKSSLLKILYGAMEPSHGNIQYCDNAIVAYVPQLIEEFDSLSGGQRRNKAMTRALSLQPNVLLLDEPTNHLDQSYRKSLLHMLNSYFGTLIVVSHDTELLRHYVDTLWHIDDEKIQIFSGNYDDYIHELHVKRASIEQELSNLNKQKKEMHLALMREQQRASRSRAKGEKSIEQRKWPTVVSHAKASRAEKTSGRKKSAIDNKKQELTEQLSKLRVSEIIIPKFSVPGAKNSEQTLVSIRDGSIGYENDNPLLRAINLSIRFEDRIAILGENASGKSTLIKAIMNDEQVIKSGQWSAPKLKDIGYLDQHYGTVSPAKTVLETITELVPTWSYQEVRCHLNDFLFRKNEEVQLQSNQLSGGEKARLALAQIAVLTPKLLILDEVTNNLDLETKNHVIDVLKNYPGAMMVISHDADFLMKIGVVDSYQISNGRLFFYARI